MAGDPADFHLHSVHAVERSGVVGRRHPLIVSNHGVFDLVYDH